MDGDYKELRGSGQASLHKRAVSLIANYLLGRPKNRFEEAEQLDDVWLRPSSALAGVTYAMDGGKGMQQPGAGIEHGKIRGIKSLRFKLNTVTAGKLEGRNIIPACMFGKEPVFMGASTLFTGEIHNVYSNRRTLDYVSKNIKHFLNQVTFQTIDFKLLNSIQERVKVFMDGLCKQGMIAKVDAVDIIATDEMKKRFEVKVETQFTPLFPVKYFNLEVAAAGQGKKAFKDGQKAG
jgi:Type VI secretion system, TssC, VipB